MDTRGPVGLAITGRVNRFPRFLPFLGLLSLPGFLLLPFSVSVALENFLRIAKNLIHSGYESLRKSPLSFQFCTINSVVLPADQCREE